MKKLVIYMGSSWFTPEQMATKNKAFALLKKNPTVDYEASYRPNEHQWGDHVFNVDPKEDEKWFSNKDWQRHTYHNDILGLKRCDVALFIKCDDSEDPGQAFALGYANALNIPTIVAVKDLKNGKPANLMLACSPDKFITIDELDKFDFTNFDWDEFDGPVY